LFVRGFAPIIARMLERFAARLQREFDEKRRSNPRYSLRAFAELLGSDHSTLSQIFRGQRPVPLPSIRKWCRKLDLDPEVAVAYIAAEHLPDVRTVSRESQMRHWVAEASAILTESLHWEIYRLCSRPCKLDSRQLAERMQISTDQVNVAFTRLLRLGLIRTTPSGRWVAAQSENAKSQKEFQRQALKLVREKAAEAQVKIPRSIALL